MFVYHMYMLLHTLFPLQSATCRQFSNKGDLVIKQPQITTNYG